MSDRAVDPDGLRYFQHWEPVLSAAALRALERIEPEPKTFLDLGAGTGSLALAAAQRWPAARVVALDASDAMLTVARSRAKRSGTEGARFEWTTADAADMPLPGASVDAVASSFLLQLVPDRPAVLAEVLRVLRPGGTFSFVTWLADDLVLPADAAYHDVLRDLDGDDEDEEPTAARCGDYVSPEQAREELVEAGFVPVEVIPDVLRYAWTAESYLGFKAGYDDLERFDTLDDDAADRLREALRARLATLPPSDFELRGTLVAAVARRPIG